MCEVALINRFSVNGASHTLRAKIESSQSQGPQTTLLKVIQSLPLLQVQVGGVVLEV